MRTKLSDKYQAEREAICNKIIEILGDKTFILCDLDEDIEKQNKILELKSEIQQYFASSRSFLRSKTVSKIYKMDLNLLVSNH